MGHFTVVASFIVEFGASGRGFAIIDCPSNSCDNLFDHRHIMFWSIFFVLVRHINLIICDQQILGLLGGDSLSLTLSPMRSSVRGKTREKLKMMIATTVDGSDSVAWHVRGEDGCEPAFKG